MRVGHNPPPPARPKRHLKTKPVLIVLGILLLGNLLWFIAWLIPNGSEPNQKEEVAQVDGESITREQWMAAMEKSNGREVLRDLVNEHVMAAAAKKYDISVSDKEIDLEIALSRSVQDSTDMSFQTLDKQMLHDKMKARLILEKVLTKDVVVSDEETTAYFSENESIYNIPTTYRTSVIEVLNENEANEVVKELDKGSSFEALARERSIQLSSASLGGDIGFITANQDSVDSAIRQAAQSLKAKEWSQPVTLKNGHSAIVYVTEIIDGQSFSYDEVKEHIRREIALDQLPQSVSPEAFWKEFDATWFYGE